MDKRYQVFVSSTYADLHDERQEVMQALLELDCIPAGMELFPAANEDQWTLIKKVIDDCDYYMVIIAGRYGSIGTDGLSFTEMEYRYALETGKPVLGFIHRDQGKLIADRCESSDEGKKKLETFRDLVKKKVCRFWENPSDLGSQVSRSLVKLIKNSPGIGWVRGNLVPDESATEEILSLRRWVEELQAELQAIRTSGPEGTSELAQGEDTFKIRFSYTTAHEIYEYENRESIESSIILKWDEIFSALSPQMIHEAEESQLAEALDNLVREHAWQDLHESEKRKGRSISNLIANSNDFQTIKIQFRALGLIAMSTKNRSVHDTLPYWTLTPYGDNCMTKLRAIRKPRRC